MFRKNYKNQFNKKNNNYEERCDYKKSNHFLPHDHSGCAHNHHHSLFEEICCHLPWAIFALSISYIMFFILTIFMSQQQHGHDIYENLFHIIHYIHILCAIMGSMIIFNKFNIKNKFVITFFSVLNSIIFCTLSDIVFPVLATHIIHFSLPLHICFFSYHDAINLAFFVILGILGGLGLIYGNQHETNIFSKKLHFAHIWFGCMAALLYIIAHVTFDWFENVGILIILLCAAVIIPCTISDVVIPISISYYYNSKKNIYNQGNNNHQGQY